MKRYYYIILIVFCAVCLCLFLHTMVISNVFFDMKQMEKKEYNVLIMDDYGIHKGIYKLKCEKKTNTADGRLYCLKLYNSDSKNFDMNHEILLGIFCISKKEIKKIDSESQQCYLVCKEENVQDALEEDETGWHFSLECNGDECIYTSYNNQVETGYYEVMVWKKKYGLLHYRSGFGAGRNSIEVNQRNKD